MEITFLGTAASEGYPNPFCGCGNCERARELGGSSLRKRAAALVDGVLLIDLGPDVLAASQIHGRSLAGLRYGLQTHEHGDHLDPSLLTARSPLCGAVAPRFDFYATRGALERAAADIGHLPPAGLLDPATAERLNQSAHPIEPGQSFRLGPYEVTSVAAAHDPRLVALLYAIRRDGRALFYGTDTGPIPEESFCSLRAGGWRFDLVVLDHTFGFGKRSTGHLNAEQFREQGARFRDEGLLTDGARIVAHHIAHHSNPAHPDLAAFAAEHGYEVAYDGLTVTV